MQHHAASFRRAARDDALADAVRADVQRAPLPPRERALVEYAVELTRQPAGFSPERVAALRAAGLADDEILRVTEVTAYFNFVNRIAEALGVELEPDTK